MKDNRETRPVAKPGDVAAWAGWPDDSLLQIRARLAHSGPLPPVPALSSHNLFIFIYPLALITGFPFPL